MIDRASRAISRMAVKGLARLPVLLTCIWLSACSGCPCDDPSDEEATTTGSLQLRGAGPEQLRPSGQPVDLDVIDERATESATWFHSSGDSELPAASLPVLDGGRRLSSPLLVDGQNDLAVYARDSMGLTMSTKVQLWAGGHSLTVRVLDSNGVVVPNAQVSLRLADAPEVGTDAAASTGGIATLVNVPARSVIVIAKGTNNRLGITAAQGNAGSVEVRIGAISPPVAAPNHDFSNGTAGWKSSGGSLALVPHTEAAGRAPRQVNANDQDLVFCTSGEGPVTLSYAFIPQQSTKAVTIRYRFVTSEVPGGWFGSQFDDSFAIAIRQTDDSFQVEANSMNGLGLAAFDAAGATSWRENTAPVNTSGSTAHIDVVVANVGDAFYDSCVVVDFVEERRFEIASLELRDIDGRPLKFLSADDHSYFQGATRIHGSIALRGEPGTSVKLVDLEIVQNGAVVATAELGSNAANGLLRSFDSSGLLQVSGAPLLFQLASGSASQIDDTVNGSVLLRVRAQDSEGETIVRDIGAVQVLTRFRGANRYGGRDEALGGDDWAKPSVIEVVNYYTDLSLGDFSNMNAGRYPPHATHDTGNDVDGWYPGYNAMDGVAAVRMLEYLNDPQFGSRIRLVFAAYTATPGDPFFDAIRNVVLPDGRRADAVIQPDAGHATHFHWVISDQ